MDRYTLCQEIDKPLRIMLLTVDEFILLVPILLLGIGVFQTPLLSFGLDAGILLGLRKLKARVGQNWLLNLLYWYLPVSIFKLTPPARAQKWIA